MRYEIQSEIFRVNPYQRVQFGIYSDKPIDKKWFDEKIRDWLKEYTHVV